MGVPSLPGSHLVLETTNRCSLACVHCTVSEAGHPHHAGAGFLPLGLAEALFDDLADVGARFDVLLPFWLGEPLLHPDFGALWRAGLRAAAEHGVFRRVELHTNATHLDEGRRKAALNAAPVPQTLHLSLDAATRETYRRVKGVDRFDDVEANVAALLAEKAARRAPWPRPVLQFIVGENNAAEARVFRDRWTDRARALGLPVRAAAQRVPDGDDVVIFFRQLDAPTPEAQARENAVYRRTMASLGLALPAPDKSPTVLPAGGAVCACFWKSPVIGWDGSVTTCTRDNRLQNRLGSLYEQRFSSLWWGPAMRARRDQVARADYAGLDACQGCYIPRSANTTDITPAEVSAWG